MKKLVSILLTMAMIFAMTISAFAAETNLTIAADAEHEYVGYKLMTLTTSLKNENDGCTQHNANCYNYAYTISDASYLTILQDVTKKTTADDILKYLEENKADIQAIADNIYREIIAADIKGFNITGNAATIEQGYWLFADVTDLKNVDDANSLVMVNTKGQGNLTITPKYELPVFEKEVLDYNDTNNTSAWQDSADYDIGDKVEFKLSAEVHNYSDSYESYSLTFYDELDAGFGHINIADVVVKAYVDDTKAAELNIGGEYTVTYSEDDKKLTVDFDDIKSIENISKDAIFEVYYKAELIDTADIGEAGNINRATLKYSNNPYDTTSMGSFDDSAVVYTYELTIDKKAETEEGEALKGAGFTLYKMVNGAKRAVGDEIVGGDITSFTWKGLDDGTYILEESTVPAGYNKMTDLEFTITADHTFEGIQTLSAVGMDTDADAGTITDVVVNLSGTVLPETGAMGTIAFVGIGTMFVIVAAVFMITRKKMSIYED